MTNKELFSPDQYQLLDFGNSQKLERFGPYVLDRPAPAVENQPKADPGQWQVADARYVRRGGQSGRWLPPGALPPAWSIQYQTLTLELRPTPFGHVGLFAEQAENWDWIQQQVQRADRPVRLLNLFAYTGGSTLAAATAGAHVVHVDAARNVVQWARQNARHSGLVDAPIRWITEDARKFAQRELRRGNRYDAVVLDPPSYGHGPKGQVWRIDDDLPPLLEVCGQLMQQQPLLLVLTCHTPAFDPQRLEQLVDNQLSGTAAKDMVAKPLSLTARDGRRLPSGTVLRWPAEN